MKKYVLVLIAALLFCLFFLFLPVVCQAQILTDPVIPVPTKSELWFTILGTVLGALASLPPVFKKISDAANIAMSVLRLFKKK